MITKFTPVYADHVDLPDRGQNATPANERRYWVEAVSRRGSWAAAGVATVEHYMDLGSWFAGTPGQLVDRLKGFEERYPGMQHISLSSPIGTPESIMLEQFQWLGEEVMPAFRTGRR